MRATRLKVFIFSAIALIMLLCTAIFTVSFARWNVEGGVTSVPAQGNVGKFYVDYPQYAEGGGPMPDLKKETYYLQVQKKGGISDYYEMKENSGNTSEKMITNVYLEAGTVIDIYEYTETRSIKSKKTGTASQFVHNGNGQREETGTVSETGYYDFYYEFGWRAMYVAFTPTEYNYTFEVKYTNETSSRKLHFRSPYEPYIYLWLNDNTKYYHNNGAPKNYKEATGPVSVGTSGSGQKVIFSDSSNWENNENHQTEDLALSTYAAFPDNYITLKTTTDANKYYPEISSTKTTVNITAATSATTGVTDLSKAGKLNGDQSVRNVNAATTENDGYTYHNYVCISREGGTTETMVYVNFGVTGTGSTDISDVVVNSLTIKRISTDADGYSTSDDGTTYFVYNNPADSGGTLKDINALPKSKDPNPPPSGNTNVADDYIVGGTYIMLYFGTAENQYYALDIEITTDKEATFTLTATATNEDKRNRFKDGFGFPYGYYLGGTFNGMPMWEPRKVSRFTSNHTAELSDAQATAKEEAVELTYNDNNKDIDSKGPNYIDVELEIELTSPGDTVKLYRLGSGGQYIGAEPSLWFVPKHIYKNYSGGAGMDGSSPFFTDEMNIIIRSSGTYRIRFEGAVQYRDYTTAGVRDTTKSNSVFAFDRQENKFLSESQYNALGATNQKETLKYNGKEYDGSLRYVTLGNWNAVVENLYVTRMEEGSVDKITVELDPNGGSWQQGGNPTLSVNWGTTIPSEFLAQQPTPPVEGMTFDGWYDQAEGGTKYDDKTILMQTESPLKLYAHYSTNGRYIVTFNPNGGTLSGAEKVLAGSDNKVTRPTDPTRADYIFCGWYNDANCADANYWKFASSTVSGDTTLYAKWLKASDYSGGYVVINGTPFQMNAEGGEYTFIATVTVNDEIWFIVNGVVPTFTIAQAQDNALVMDGAGRMAIGNVNGAYTLTFRMTSGTAGTLTATKYNNSFTITFDPNGGELDSNSRTAETGDGGKLTSIPTPSRSGYTFDGWWTSETGGSPVDTSYEFKDDTTVYAHWTVIQYTIQYVNSIDGSLVDGNILPSNYTKTYTVEINNNGTLALVASGELKLSTGVKFAGWTLSENGTDYVTQITKEDINSASGDNIIKIYAHWKYTVKFVSDGSTVKEEDVVENTTTTVPSVSKKHHELNGWTGDDTTSIAKGATVTGNITGPVTYEAQWTGLTYTITLDANDGTLGSVTSLSTTAGTGKLSSDELARATATRDFYDFDYWTTTKNGSSSTRVTTSTEFSGNVSIYAHWTIKADGLYINKTFKASMTENKANTSTVEYMLTAVELSSTGTSQTVDIIYDGEVVDYGFNGSSTNKVSKTADGTRYYINTAFLFDFYYDTKNNILYVGTYYMKITFNNGNSYIYITLDDSDGYNRRSVWDYLNNNAYVHMWTDGSSGGTTWPGYALTANNGNTYTLNNATTSTLRVIINNGNYEVNGKKLQTNTLSGPSSSTNWSSGSAYRVQVYYNDNWSYVTETITTLTKH